MVKEIEEYNGHLVVYCNKNGNTETGDDMKQVVFDEAYQVRLLPALLLTICRQLLSAREVA